MVSVPRELPREVCKLAIGVVAKIAHRIHRNLIRFTHPHSILGLLHTGHARGIKSLRASPSSGGAAPAEACACGRRAAVPGRAITRRNRALLAGGRCRGRLYRGRLHCDRGGPVSKAVFGAENRNPPPVGSLPGLSFGGRVDIAAWRRMVPSRPLGGAASGAGAPGRAWNRVSCWIRRLGVWNLRLDVAAVRTALGLRRGWGIG